MTTPAVSFSGLATGMDTSSIIQQLIALDQQPITDLQNDQANVQAAQSTVSQFSSLLSSFSSAASALSQSSSFNTCSATASDSNITVSTTGSSTPGSYDVTVQQLAQAQRSYSSIQSTDTGAVSGLTAGTLALTCGTNAEVDINVSATDSLADIAAKINGSGADCTANVLYTGSGYTMQLCGKNTGEKVDYSTNTTAGVASALGLHDYQAAQSAIVQVDGNTFTRASNNITDILPGVSMVLNNVSSKDSNDNYVPTTITTSPNPSAVEANINTFVSAYNALVSADQTDTGYGTNPASNTYLQSDSAIRGSVQQLADMVTSDVPGATGKYQGLADVGISINEDGTLSFDSSTFEAAVQDDPASVAKLFVDNPTTDAAGAMTNIVNAVTNMTMPEGTIAADIKGFSDQSTSMGTDISNMQDQLTQEQTTLQTQFTNMELIVEQYKSLSSAISSISTTA